MKANKKITAQQAINILLKQGYTRTELIKKLKTEKQRVLQHKLNNNTVLKN